MGLGGARAGRRRGLWRGQLGHQEREDLRLELLGTGAGGD